VRIEGLGGKKRLQDEFKGKEAGGCVFPNKFRFKETSQYFNKNCNFNS